MEMDGNTLGYVADLRFRELVSPVENELIKSNVYSIIKLTKTVSEFCGKLATIKEQTAASLVSLVEVFRKKTNDVKKRPDCQSHTFLAAWDQILNEVENESKDLNDLGHLLQRTVAGPLYNSAAKKKNFCKKSFAYRETCHMQINKSEEELSKKHKDYSDAWYKFNTHDKETLKDHHIAVYHNRHNEFLLQLASVNSMNETLFKNTVPEILDDVEKVHKDLSNSLLKYLKTFLSIQKDSLNKLGTRMDNAVESAKKIDAEADLNDFVKYIDLKMCDRRTPFKKFFPPRAMKEFKSESDAKQATYLNKCLVVNQYTEPMLKRTVACSRKKINDLDASMQRLQAQLNSSTGSQKADDDSLSQKDSSVDENELISKRNELRDQHCQFRTLRAQLTLVTPEVLEKLGPIPEEYTQNSNKPTITIVRPNDPTVLTRREKPHHFIEHNFLKPSQCYYCRGIIVGLVKQGFKCQNCRMNVHKKCKTNVPFCSGTSISSKRASISNQGDLSTDESLYEEIEPDVSPSLKIKSKQTVNHQDIQEIEQDPYELPQPVKISGPTPTGALPPRNSILNEPLPTLPQEVFWVVSLYDFEGEESIDLAVSAGDKIQVLGKSSEEWWEGVIGGKKGYFPSAYVETIKESDVILRCMYPFEGDAESDELSLEEGEILILIEDEGNGWTIGKSKGKTGAFPSSYIEKVS